MAPEPPYRSSTRGRRPRPCAAADGRSASASIACTRAACPRCACTKDPKVARCDRGAEAIGRGAHAGERAASRCPGFAARRPRGSSPRRRPPRARACMSASAACAAAASRSRTRLALDDEGHEDARRSLRRRDLAQVDGAQRAAAAGGLVAAPAAPLPASRLAIARSRTRAATRASAGARTRQPRDVDDLVTAALREQADARPRGPR